MTPLISKKKSSSCVQNLVLYQETRIVSVSVFKFHYRSPKPDVFMFHFNTKKWGGGLREEKEKEKKNF